MYDSNFKLTYHNYQNDELYRSELLKCLGLTSIYIDLNHHIKDIYKLFQVYSYNNLIKIINFLKKDKKVQQMNSFYPMDNIDIFCFAFSYEYFYKIHPCICDIIDNRYISPNNLEFLNKSCKKK